MSETTKLPIYKKVEFTTERFYGPTPQKITAIIINAEFDKDWGERFYSWVFHDEARNITGKFTDKLMFEFNESIIMSEYDNGKYESISEAEFNHHFACASVEF